MVLVAIARHRFALIASWAGGMPMDVVVQLLDKRLPVRSFVQSKIVKIYLKRGYRVAADRQFFITILNMMEENNWDI